MFGEKQLCLPYVTMISWCIFQFLGFTKCFHCIPSWKQDPYILGFACFFFPGTGIGRIIISLVVRFCAKKKKEKLEARLTKNPYTSWHPTGRQDRAQGHLPSLLLTSATLTGQPEDPSELLSIIEGSIFSTGSFSRGQCSAHSVADTLKTKCVTRVKVHCRDTDLGHDLRNSSACSAGTRRRRITDQNKVTIFRMGVHIDQQLLPLISGKASKSEWQQHPSPWISLSHLFTCRVISFILLTGTAASSVPRKAARQQGKSRWQHSCPWGGTEDFYPFLVKHFPGQVSKQRGQAVWPSPCLLLPLTVSLDGVSASR